MPRQTYNVLKLSPLFCSLVSFVGIIVSRKFELTENQRSSSAKEDDKQNACTAEEQSTSVILGYSKTVLVLRVKNLCSMDEISVYINLDEFSYIKSLIPGCRVELRNLQRKVSGLRTVYCSVVKSTSIQTISFCKDDLSSVKERKISSKVDGEMRKYLIDFASSSGNLLTGLNWQLKLEFVDAVWASFCWKCNVCKRTVARGMCSPACLQNWTFISQLVCVVEDGTAEGHLQIEQNLLKNFLSIGDIEWTNLQNIAKQQELNYQRENETYCKLATPQSTNTTSNRSQRMSKRRKAYLMIMDKLKNVYQRGPYLVECKTFKDGSKRTVKDNRSRSIIVGNSEYITKAPQRINLQAICIENINFSQETLHVISELNLD